jgi:hypothetical protein
MDTQIIFVYCLCDDLLKALGHREDPQCQVPDAEILTTALVAALDFGGCFKRAHRFLHEAGYLPYQLSASRFVRRLHRCEPFVMPLFHVLANLGHQSNTERLYIIDSFPLPVCDNIRIRRCRRYQGEAWRGYQASKRRYFYGLKIHLMVTAQGQPVEFFLTPGADSDAKALKQYAFDLPAQATITGDKADNDYHYEDLLEEAGLHLLPLRKKNSKRPHEPALTYLMSSARHAVETTGSLIERLLPKHIHSVTAAGFELKTAFFILACSLNFLF